jgi:hypothetical protein
MTSHEGSGHRRRVGASRHGAARGYRTAARWRPAARRCPRLCAEYTGSTRGQRTSGRSGHAGRTGDGPSGSWRGRLGFLPARVALHAGRVHDTHPRRGPSHPRRRRCRFPRSRRPRPWSCRLRRSEGSRAEPCTSGGSVTRHSGRARHRGQRRGATSRTAGRHTAGIPGASHPVRQRGSGELQMVEASRTATYVRFPIWTPGRCVRERRTFGATGLLARARARGRATPRSGSISFVEPSVVLHGEGLPRNRVASGSTRRSRRLGAGPYDIRSPCGVSRPASRRRRCWPESTLRNLLAVGPGTYRRQHRLRHAADPRCRADVLRQARAGRVSLPAYVSPRLPGTSCCRRRAMSRDAQ